MKGIVVWRLVGEDCIDGSGRDSMNEAGERSGRVDRCGRLGDEHDGWRVRGAAAESRSTAAEERECERDNETVVVRQSLVDRLGSATDSAGSVEQISDRTTSDG